MVDLKVDLSATASQTCVGNLTTFPSLTLSNNSAAMLKFDPSGILELLAYVIK